ncbi:MAG: hypothetical protein M3179_04950 [Actinomycetota bacterium]|nr:hypothetical protein [Actinomycetota bacterium]
MKRRAIVENRRDRKALVEDAGLGKVSLVSVIAGTLVAYGAFALLAGLAGAILDGLDADTDVAARWRDVGVAGGLVLAAVLFVAYLFGGYVAGRMARRAGTTHGVGVFVLGILAVVAVAGAVSLMGGSDDILARLRDLGLPTTGDEWADIGTVAGLASLVAMLLGSLFGGSLGERWHSKLLARAVDPHVGPEATARRQAEEAPALAADRHTESMRRVDAANPTREGAYSDGTGPAYGPTAGVPTTDRPAADRIRRVDSNGRPVDGDDTVVDANPDASVVTRPPAR